MSNSEVGEVLDPRPDDPLARYLFTKNHFARTKELVKPGAFLPPPDLNLSVFQTRGLSTAQVWRIGGEVAMARGRTLRARANLSVSAVLEAKLRVAPDNMPPRHANIVGWPETEEARLSLAQQLAASASLHLPL